MTETRERAHKPAPWCFINGELYIRQLENKKKWLIQEQKEQERRERTNRLCKRMGLFEKLLPDSITLTKEQFKTFLEQTAAAEQGRRLLEEMTAQNATSAAAAGAERRHRVTPAPLPKPPIHRRRAAQTGAKGNGLAIEPGRRLSTSLSGCVHILLSCYENSELFVNRIGYFIT